MLAREFVAQIAHLACDRTCETGPLCHRPLSLSRSQLARLAGEFRGVAPDRWLCASYVLEHGDANIPEMLPDTRHLEGLTSLAALTALEKIGGACGAVDVQYTANRREAFVLYLYWLGGVAAGVVTRYTGLSGTVVAARDFDAGETLGRFVAFWREAYAPVSEAVVDQVSQVLR